MLISSAGYSEPEEPNSVKLSVLISSIRGGVRCGVSSPVRYKRKISDINSVIDFN